MGPERHRQGDHSPATGGAHGWFMAESGAVPGWIQFSRSARTDHRSGFDGTRYSQSRATARRFDFTTSKSILGPPPCCPESSPRPAQSQRSRKPGAVAKAAAIATTETPTTQPVDFARMTFYGV